MKLFKYSLLMLSLFLANGAFAADPTTPNPLNLTETSVEFSFIPDESNLTEVGYLLNKDKNKLYGGTECTNTIPHQQKFLVKGNQYKHTINNLTENTVYYYSICYKIDGISDRFVDIEKSFKTLNPQNTGIETVSVINNGNSISYTTTEINLTGIIQGGDITESGFLISTDLNAGFLSKCNITQKKSHINGSRFSSKYPVESGKEYTYHACGKNSQGKLFFGNIFKFTVPTADANQEIEKCNIDYVEFSPKNKSNIILDSPEYQNFVNGQGKSIDLIIHPKNASDCKNVNIDTLFIIETTDSIKDDYKIISSGEVRYFSENGTFKIPLVAGDEGCDSKGKCEYGVAITYGKFKKGDGFYSKSFKTYGRGAAGNSEYDHQQPSSKDKDKGTLHYEKRSGTNKWRVRSVNEPEYIPGVTPTYDIDSPCYEKNSNGNSGGYSDNCYEFLAPIPGFSSKLGDVETVTDKNGNVVRVAIKNLNGFQLGDYVQSIFNIALGLLMVLSVVMIVFAGVEYMTVESIYGKSKAKGRITGAVTGLILALGIFLILETINPRLLEINFGDGIEKVSIDTKEYDQAQLNYISNLNTDNIVIPSDSSIYSDLTFLGYLYHQQGVAGASGHLWNASRGYNPHRDSKFRSGDQLRSAMKNNGGIKSPGGFVKYFYQKIKAAELLINKIPQENANAIEKAAKEVGVSPEALKAMCLIETAGCKDPKTTNAYGYQGLFQFCGPKCKSDNKTWVKPFIRVDNANIEDPYENAYAAAKMLQQNMRYFNRNKEEVLNQ